jgi:hypothetical protein
MILNSFFFFQNADYRLRSTSYASEIYATPRLQGKCMREIVTSRGNDDISASSHQIMYRDDEGLEQQMASATETSVRY